MSLKYQVLLTLVICLFSKVFVADCVVVSVSRDITDSFRIGKHGCTRNASICPACSKCQPDGSCLCSALTPKRNTFRSPIITARDGKKIYLDTYGCNHNKLIKYPCEFSPFQAVPYSKNYPRNNFSYNGKTGDTVNNCSLRQTLIKFPDKTEDMEVKWLDESYVDLKISNNHIYFKWKISVERFQGTIITLKLNCTVNSTPKTECLRAKIIGNWSENSTFLINEPIKPTAPDVDSKITTKTTHESQVRSSLSALSLSTDSDSREINTVYNMSSVNEPSTKSTRIDVMSKTTNKTSQSSYDTSSIKESSTKPSRPTTLNSRPNTNKKTSQNTFRPSPTGQLPGSDHDSRKVTTVYDMSSVNEPSTKSTRLHIMSKTAIKTSPTSLRHESSTVQLASTKPSHSTTLHSLSKTNKKMPQKTFRPGFTGQLPGSDHDSMKTTTFSLATKSTRSTTSDVRSKNNRKTSQKTLLRSSPTVQMPSIDSDSNETTIALCIVLPIILGLLLILLVGLFCRRRKRNHRKLKISSHENRGKKTDPTFETPDVNVNMKEINGDHSHPVDQDISDTTQALVRHSNQDDQCVIVEADPIYDASHVELINQTPDFKKKEIAGDNFHSDPDCESPDGKSWADDEDILDTTETLSSDFNPDDQSVVVMSNPIYEAPEVNAPVEEKKDDSLSSYQLQPEWKTSELKYKEIDDANFHPNSENTEHESAD